jgi:anti-anti-sigma regulatory factor
MKKPVKRPAVKAKAKAKVKVKAKAKSNARAKSKAKVKVKSTAGTSAPKVAAPVATASDPFFLKLDASCTLRETGDLQFSLVAARGDPVVVDGSGVERIDTSGLQLLVALVRRQQLSGGRVEWKAVSPELAKCSERLGLNGALGLSGAEPGEMP